MSHPQSTNVRVEASIQAFQAHCQEFFAWRRDAGEAFDEPLYRDAMEKVIALMKGMEQQTEAGA